MLPSVVSGTYAPAKGKEVISRDLSIVWVYKTWINFNKTKLVSFKFITIQVHLKDKCILYIVVITKTITKKNKIKLPCIERVKTLITSPGITISFSLTNTSSPTDTCSAYLKKENFPCYAWYFSKLM